MSLKKKTILNVCLFALIFGGLLITATFTDLQVSQLLTKNVLEPGRYYTESFFGACFETIGTAPEYLIGAFMAEIIFWYVLRIWEKGAKQTVFALIALSGAGTLYFMWVKEAFGYVTRHYTEAVNTNFLYGVMAFFALLLALLGTLAVRNFSDESLKKLIRFAAVSCVAMIVATLIVQGLKIPFGRMRYRAMNVIGDFGKNDRFPGFTRWYVIGGQPDKQLMRDTFGTSDAFKSFPSGHTRGAAATFYLAAMGSVLGLSKGKRAALWVFAIVFTGLVAVSRIMVGAHFFSDVLVGGTVGFLCCVLSKEFFVDRGVHCKALLSRAA